MDFDDIKCFVTVAHTLNFRAAAEKLYVSQSVLSRKIRALEQELGVPLFERTTRCVMLTAAGKACLQNAQRILDEMDAMTMRAVEAQRGEVGTLRIGYYGRANTVYIQDTLRHWKKQYPQIMTHVIKSTHDEYRKVLYEGIVDVLLILKPCIADLEGISMMTVIEETPSVRLPKNHPLAGRDKIALSELKDEKFIMHSRQHSEYMYDALIGLCQRTGFSPNVVLIEDDDYLASLRTAMGDGIGLYPTELTVYGNRGQLEFSQNTIRIPVSDNHEDFERVVAWRTDNHNPCIRLFCDMLAKVVEENMKKD